MDPRTTLAAFDRAAARAFAAEVTAAGGKLKEDWLNNGPSSLAPLLPAGDLQDCIALAPTPAELAEATTWLEPLDLNPGWPAHVRATLGDLARRLGHGS